MRAAFLRQVEALWQQIRTAERTPGANLAALDRAWSALWREAGTVAEETLCTQLGESIQALNDHRARREGR